MNIEQIAAVCHEANRAYCQQIGDDSQPSWGDAPDWQKESAIVGVKFHVDNPDAKPCDSHKEWCKLKVAEGWQYGPVKDQDKKEHPCLMPYEQLPNEQKYKDALFIAVVRVLSVELPPEVVGKHAI